MSEKVRVLGIAPYEGMKRLMADLGEEYPQMDLNLYVGDREIGLSIAKDNFHGNYDVIVSRGGTAEMLRRNQPLPVIEIEISGYDLIYALRAAGALGKKAAVVCADNVADHVKAVTQRVMGLMETDMDMLIYDSQAAAVDIIHGIRKDQYNLILCDMVAYTMAKSRGLNASLIESDADNIRHAFEQALLLCRSQQHLRDENQFLRELLSRQIGYTTILDDDGGLYLSTMNDMPAELLELLRKELPESISVHERRITRGLNGMLYVIRSRRIYIGSVGYTAFFYDIRRTPLQAGHVGIRTCNRPEAEERYARGVFGMSGLAAQTILENEKLQNSTAPVMVIGESGSGKESVVDILYLNGPLRNNPQITINCAALGEKEWDFLLDHYNSPLADEGSTLHLVNVDTMPAERCRRLIVILKSMRVCSRNRVFFSCTAGKGEPLSGLAEEIIEELCCLKVELPALRELSERIPVMVERYLDSIRPDTMEKITVAPQAMELLQEYHWPHNFIQFRRVMNELMVSSVDQTITAASVRVLLRKERYVGTLPRTMDISDAPLDLTQPLEDINRDIIRRVLEETKGNQTAAARRLGISRTTLWRMVQTTRPGQS